MTFVAVTVIAGCSYMKGSKVVAVTINDECKYPIAKIVEAFYKLDGVIDIDESKYKMDKMYRNHVIYLKYEHDLFLIPLKAIEGKAERFGCKVNEVRKVYV